MSNLKSTAIEAAKDISSTASVHAKKVQDNLQSVATNAKQEGAVQLDQAKATLADLGVVARDYIAARPVASVATALFFGFLVGKMRSR